MAPDTPESRLARSEERIASNQRQIEMLASLPLQVGLIQERLDSLRVDLRERDVEVDRRFEKHEKSTAEALERLARSFENQVIACKGSVDDVARSQRDAAEAFVQWQKDEAKRRKDEATEIRQTATQRLIARYGLVGVLIAALIGACASILNTFLG